MGDFVSTATHRDFGPILHYLYVRSKHISIPNNNCTIRAPHQQQIHSTIYMSILAQKKSTRFGHFGGFVLDFPIFIYW